MRFVLALLLLFAVIGISRPVLADPGARCTVRAIRGTHSADDGGIDRRLGDLGRQLAAPPFTEWKSFRLLSSNELALDAGGTAGFALPDNRRGMLTYKQHLMHAGRHRVRLHLEVVKGSETELSTIFVLDEGGTVLSASHRKDGTMLIFAIACKTDS